MDSKRRKKKYVTMGVLLLFQCLLSICVCVLQWVSYYCFNVCCLYVPMGVLLLFKCLLSICVWVAMGCFFACLLSICVCVVMCALLLFGCPLSLCVLRLVSYCCLTVHCLYRYVCCDSYLVV